MHEQNQRKDHKRSLGYLPLRSEKPNEKLPGSLVENVSTVVFPQRLSRREKKF